VTTTHSVIWEQLSDTTTAAGSSVAVTMAAAAMAAAAAVAIAAAVAAAAAAAAAALRLVLNYKQYASAPIEQNGGARIWKINVPSSGIARLLRGVSCRS